MERHAPIFARSPRKEITMESEREPATVSPRETETVSPHPTSELCLAAVFLFFGACVGVCLFLGHPSDYAWLPSCPFRVWSGLLCPGCGALRATHYLLNGQWVTAFRFQPLLVLSLPVLVLFSGKVLYENLRKTSVALPFEKQLYWLLLIIVCLFFVLRNVPLDCFDCLRPPVIASHLPSEDLG